MKTDRFIQSSSRQNKPGSIFFSTILIGLVAILNCSKEGIVRSSVVESSPSVEKSKIFLAGHTGEYSKDSDEILSILRKLIAGTVQKDLSFLPNLVSEEEGIYLDIKGHWTRKKLVEELSAENNYFRTYFFDRDALERVKKNSNVRTVRDLLLSSKGIEADFYFETPSACEVKLRFKENRKLESELINPYFSKIRGKWYVHRLF
ncbi:hypothetical protein LEP1GSC050_4255 [Leptospira broomii serovar Hurstbridge str. 5399]|uniref:Uncharacterized protein n=1 Tax=Leptospira broomii serovar Hurstbridge str. 5399 TaxID=1049789 RepID=T0FA11_9LEPT|nr:hypothetical protein [Leptospira broomii]EQA44731.1 hypothetical protein LEP1GSC050_4255 [Leptospira broomii serovar Hurstbridge str. 5399]